MYELVFENFSNIKSIIDFLNDIGKIEALKENFGIIDNSTDIDKLYTLHQKTKKYNLKTKIIETYFTELPHGYTVTDNIEIKNIELILDGKRQLIIKDIKAILIHFIKEPCINPSPLISIEQNTDLISLKTSVYLELVSNKNRTIIPDKIKFTNHSKLFDLNFSGEKNIFELFEFISLSNPNIILGPLVQIYKENYNYVKYFIKEVIDNKEVLWMIKTKMLNI